ncbi:MAG: hypothetical protein HY051_00665, partial [Candidatus Aenigmarchaeota archaeon]|nr:hypothetical protein [Candidatus Aenigmarchaeota archaeon]
MKLSRRAAPVFIFSLFLITVLPSIFILAQPYWEPCTSALSCQSRGSEVGLSATYLCHRSAVDGNWKWETQAVVQAEVESDISVSGICSDNYD